MLVLGFGTCVEVVEGAGSCEYLDWRKLRNKHFFEPCKDSFIRLTLTRQFSASKSRVTRVAENRVDGSRSLE